MSCCSLLSSSVTDRSLLSFSTVFWLLEENNVEQHALSMETLCVVQIELFLNNYLPFIIAWRLTNL